MAEAAAVQHAGELLQSVSAGYGAVKPRDEAAAVAVEEASGRECVFDSQAGVNGLHASSPQALHVNVAVLPLMQAQETLSYVSPSGTLVVVCFLYGIYC